ncbi:SRPBCC domain-containing protein [Actinoplanes sp. NPDC051494]|uniref:SRPBCC domain-containing protein n=1 Tax=Actinoplanes sp. NPDC051494 TaxID=3363907 RepID=UPI00379A5C30
MMISSHKDVEQLTITSTAEFTADVERVWQVWQDPRQLERWWGPPTWPATFEEHDFRPGGGARYYMTGPDGEKAGGWWTITAVDAPRRLEFDDGFAGDDGEPSASMPVTRTVVTLEPTATGTRMVTTSLFPDLESLEKVVAMGVEEGMSLAMGQIDAVLAG